MYSNPLSRGLTDTAKRVLYWRTSLFMRVWQRRLRLPKAVRAREGSRRVEMLRTLSQELIGTKRKVDLTTVFNVLKPILL